jgi:hypothetical protein
VVARPERVAAGDPGGLIVKRDTGTRGIRCRRIPFEWALLLVSLAATLPVVAGLVVSGLTGP